MRKKIFTLLTLMLAVCSGAWADVTTLFDANDFKDETVTSEVTIGNATWYGGSKSSIDNGKTIAEVIWAKRMKLGSSSTFQLGTDYAAVLALTVPSAGTLKVYFASGKTDDLRTVYVSKAPSSTNRDTSTAIGSGSDSGSGSVANVIADAAGTYYFWSDNNISIYGVTFEASAPAKAYTVTAASNNNSYGTAAAAASSLDEGETTTVIATPETGYEFTNWAVEGTGATLSSTTTNPTTLTMGTADATVTATFSAINYTITHNAATGGTYTISVAGGEAVNTNATANYGQTITLAGTPTDPADTYIRWNVKDASNNDVTVTNNQFTMPASNVTIAPEFSEPLTLNTLFSMADITAITNSTENSQYGTVTATISDGSSVEVFNNKGDADGLLYSSSINLNGSGDNYIHITFPTKLVEGDVISATFLSNTQGWKLNNVKNKNSASEKTNPYTLTSNDAFIGATELYIYKVNAGCQITAITIEGEGQLLDLEVNSSTTPTLAIGETSTITTSSSSTGAITYSSSDTDVATVSSEGVITAVDGGTATITINQAADATYRAGVATVTVTVPAIALLKIKTLGGTSTKTSGNASFTADVNLSSNRKMDKGKYVGFTLNGDYSLKTGDIIEVKISAAGQGGKFIFYDSKGDNPNPLHDTGVAPDEAKTYRFVMPATVNNVKTIYLRRGGDNSGINEGFNPFFEYIAVYRPDAVVTLNASGFATFSYGEDFEFLGLDGAKAYKMALDEDNKTITGTEIPASTKIQAGEGILFKGEAGEPFAITATTGAEALTGNDLKGSTQSNGTTATKPTYCYVLSGDTFVSYTGATLSANKAYFEATQDLSTNARAFTMTFEDGEKTGINAVLMNNERMNNEVYNLNGQRVAQPTKGLYIVNGKKVVIK